MSKEDTASQSQPCDAGPQQPRADFDAAPSGAVRERPILFSAPMVRALLDGRKTQTRRVVKPRPPTEKDFPHSIFGMSPAVADGIKMYSMDDYARLPKHPTEWELFGSVGVARDAGFPKRYRCPYGAPGDLLWVREAWRFSGWCPAKYSELGGAGMAADVEFAADGARRSVRHPSFDIERIHTSGRASIHMPRWASRLTLRITDVRVERLQDISDDDAEAEGCPPCPVCHDIGWINSGPDGGWQCTAPGCGDAHRDQYRRLWEQINGPGSWDANPWVWVVEFQIAPPVIPSAASASAPATDEPQSPPQVIEARAR